MEKSDSKANNSHGTLYMQPAAPGIEIFVLMTLETAREMREAKKVKDTTTRKVK